MREEKFARSCMLLAASLTASVVGALLQSGWTLLALLLSVVLLLVALTLEERGVILSSPPRWRPEVSENELLTWKYLRLKSGRDFETRPVESIANATHDNAVQGGNEV
jgi:hypothetical protein